MAMAESGILATHVLNFAKGVQAAGFPMELRRLDPAWAGISVAAAWGPIRHPYVVLVRIFLGDGPAHYHAPAPCSRSCRATHRSP